MEEEVKQIKNKKQLNLSKKKIGITVVFVLLLIVALGITIYGINVSNQIEITQLQDNGPSQMMGYFIKAKNDTNIMIDGGTRDDTENVINTIHANGGKVDVWFVTHPHKDHVGALIEIIENTEIPIEKIYVSLSNKEWYEQYGGERGEEGIRFLEVIQNERIKNKVEEVSFNQKIKIQNIECEILGTKNEEITTNAMNNASMVIKMKVNNKSILFLGDTGVESSAKLLQSQKEKLKADVVQVAHHGQSGATEELYQAINPSVAMWPTPKWLWENDNGGGEDSGPWKTKETRNWMEKLEVKENIIGKDGNKSITIY